MEVCRERGIGWHVSRTWEGTRERERAIKDRAESPRLCPDCTPSPKPVTRGRSASPAPIPETLAPAPDMPWPWPGKPDLEAAANDYAKYLPVLDALESQWKAEAASLPATVPAPREPEPEPEMELEL